MDLGNFLHLFQGSNKKLLEGKIAEIAATEEPVQGQYPDSPDAPGVMGGPVPTETPYDISRYPNSPDDPNRPRNFGYSPNPPVRTPSNVPYDISQYPNSPDMAGVSSA